MSTENVLIAGVFDSFIDDVIQEQLSQLIRKPGDIRDPSIYKDNELPVDILTFIDDPYLSGEPVNFQPAVREILWDIEDPEVREVDLEIGKGSGKSEVCITCQVYGAYLLSRMKNPHAFWGLAGHTMISSINVSINENQAKDVVFKGVKSKMESSPYFRSLRPTFYTIKVELPGNIALFCGHSGSKAFLGYGTVRAVMDETNFMLNTNKRSVAEELYGMLSGSMKTRAPNHYKLVNVSSTSLPTTWLHERCEQAKEEGSPYIRRIPMHLKIVAELNHGKIILEVVAEQKYDKKEVIRTLDTEHQYTATRVFGWEEFGGQYRCMVHAARKVLDGI